MMLPGTPSGMSGLAMLLVCLVRLCLWGWPGRATVLLGTTGCVVHDAGVSQGSTEKFHISREELCARVGDPCRETSHSQHASLNQGELCCKFWS